ncbi:MAG: hypothetical protein IT167_07365 [Bryobacterales bacterium]|nr:hypothetical protein [Bryobacterales bacterium]
MRFFPLPRDYHLYARDGEFPSMTRRPVLLLLALAAPLPAVIGNRGRVEYVGGTVEGISAGINGLLKTTDRDYLIFVTKTATLKVLYEHVNLLEYGQTVSRRYALAILISPVLILSKKRKHFLTIGYVDDDGRQQAMVFTVDKNDIRTALASLEARTGRKVEFQDNEARKAGRG